MPDIYVMGKALGGGIMPLSAIAADGDIMGVITPGSHGSTFGGNPFAAAIARFRLLVAAMQRADQTRLRDVLAVAGYVHADDGRRYVLVAIVNHAQAAAARPVLDALIDWTANTP